MAVGTDPEFSQYKAQPEVEIRRQRQCLAGCNRGDCKITCSHTSRNLLHRLRDTPGEPGLVCQCISASAWPALAWNHMLALLLLAASALLDLAANLVLHLIKLAHGALQCPEAVGVFSVPYGVPTSSWTAKGERQESDSAALCPSPCQPLGHGPHQEAWYAGTHLRKLPRPQPCS